MTNQLERAYKYCETVTKKHAKSFYFASRFLPENKRKPIYALYAFCRHVDDQIDKTEIANEFQAIEEVNKWKINLEKVYQHDKLSENFSVTANHTHHESLAHLDEQISRELVLLAWGDVLKHYKIPLHLPLELIKGVLMDTYIKRYESFNNLYIYCYRVASTVGLMSSEIFGYKDKSALVYAEAMGIAMQITNILRDIAEDAKMQRIYIPQDELKTFGISEEQIFNHEISESFIELMKFQIRRARQFYEKAERGILLLEPDTRFTVLIASRLYAKILDCIEAQNYDVFSKRAHTTLIQKIFSLPKLWLETKKMKFDPADFEKSPNLR